MALNLMDLFKRIKWAKNGDVTDMSQTDYEIGWAHLGDDTPTVEDFNLIQQLTDRKDQWLFGQIYEVLKANKIEPTEQNALTLLTALQKMLLNVSNRAAPSVITELTKNTVTELGHTHEIAKANTKTTGIVKLTNDTGLDSENLALTAKAGKALSQQIAQNKLDSDSKFIPNSKKSNAINSTSSDTVATSKAVKDAYDKGVEALNKANTANSNADGRVSKAGDTIIGVLDIKNGDYSQINQWNTSGKHARPEVLPDSDDNFYKISYRSNNGNTEDHAVHFPKSGTSKVVAYRDWVTQNHLPKTGGTLSGGLTADHLNAFADAGWIGVQSRNHHSAGINFLLGNEVQDASIHATDVGSGKTELRFFTTPEGDSTKDRREHTLSLVDGELWSKAYGWLHNFFAKQSDADKIWNEFNNNVIKKSDFSRDWYPDHYAGAEVYKIRHLGLMVILMDTRSASGEFSLPESFNGFAVCFAQDKGGGRINMAGSHFIGGNKIYLSGRGDTNCHVMVIGVKNW